VGSRTAAAWAAHLLGQVAAHLFTNQDGLDLLEEILGFGQVRWRQPAAPRDWPGSTSSGLFAKMLPANSSARCLSEPKAKNPAARATLEATDPSLRSG
jgi:hypothetical protein